MSRADDLVVIDVSFAEGGTVLGPMPRYDAELVLLGVGMGGALVQGEHVTRAVLVPFVERSD